MIITDYSKTADGTRHIGQVVGLDRVIGGNIGYYEFAALGLYAWLFIPKGSRGEYQDIRSPENYSSLALAHEAALQWLTRQ
jgi:hypothetical protein